MKKILVSYTSDLFTQEMVKSYQNINFVFLRKDEVMNLKTKKNALSEFNMILLTKEDFFDLRELIINEKTHTGVMYSDISSESSQFIIDEAISFHLSGNLDEIIQSLKLVSKNIKIQDATIVEKKSWKNELSPVSLLKQIINQTAVTKIVFENMLFILTELINNVFIHTSCDSAKVSIQKEENLIWIKVENSGSQIPLKKIITSILRSPSQVEPSRHATGAQLGLYLISQISSDFILKTDEFSTTLAISIPIKRTSWDSSLIRKNIIIHRQL